jgi:hypothetical protein
MDEENLKTPIPKYHLFWTLLFRLVINFVGSESGKKQSVKLLQKMAQKTIPPPPPHSHTLSVYTVHLVWEGGKGRKMLERG